MKIQFTSLILFLAACICGASPRVEFVEKENGALQIVYYNDTGSPLRMLVIPEGLKKSSEKNISESSRWSVERGKPLSDGYVSAGNEGRTEPVGSNSISDLSEIMNRDYDRRRLAVILEWSDGPIKDWRQTKASVTYYEIK